jgi:hypothetical protein
MFMRKFICVLLVTIPFISNAQFQTDSSRFKVFLYDHFINGYVLLKSGVVEEAPLNYNTDDQSVYFIRNGKYMILSGLEEIDTVYLQNKKFVPLKSNLFEVITDSLGTSVFITYSNLKKPLVATAGHGGSSRQSANEVSNTVTSTYVNGGKLNHTSVEIEKHFWIIRKKKMYRADNLKQLKTAYPSNAREIEKFITDNQINFILNEDLLKVAAFLQGLPG